MESNLPFLAVVRILGIVVALFSLTMLLPLGFAFFNNDPALFAYDESILITAVSGIVITGLTWWRSSGWCFQSSRPFRFTDIFPT